MTNIEKRIEELEASSDLAPEYLIFGEAEEMEAWKAKNPETERVRYLIVTGVPKRAKEPDQP